MKKLIRYSVHRREYSFSMAATLLSIFILALIPSWLALQTSSNSRNARELAQFTTDSTARLEQFRSTMQTRVQALNMLAATVPHLETLNADRFEAMFRPLLLNMQSSNLCWRDFISEETFYVPRNNPDCEQFELFHSAILLTDGSPRFLLSQAAGDRTSERTGDMSLTVDIGGVTTKNTHLNVLEYFIVNYRNSQKLESFKLIDGGLESVSENDLQPVKNKIISSILDLPDLNIIYEARLIHSTDVGSLLIASIVWLAAVLLSCLVVVMRWQNRVLDREVAQRTEELTQFAYRASHDLKSPLVSIKQLSGFVVEDIRGGNHDDAVADTQRIQRQASELEILVGEILDLSTADTQITANEILDFNDIINKILRRHRDIIDMRGTQCIVEVGAGLPEASQKTRISQILDNLIVNAVKYIPPEQASPKVSISVEAEESFLVLCVKDNGIGFCASFYEAPDIVLFKRYQPRLASGSGVGLSIVSKHVERLDGSIEFEALNPGTCITVKLPIGTRT